MLDGIDDQPLGVRGDLKPMFFVTPPGGKIRPSSTKLRFTTLMVFCLRPFWQLKIYQGAEVFGIEVDCHVVADG